MIDFRNICKSFSGKDILRDITLRINPGERVGIVGPNGAGKSTLFSILMGEQSPDSGSIAIPRNHRIGIMRQHIDHRELARPLLEFTADAIPELKSGAEELKKLENDMAADLIPDADLDRALRRHGELQTMIEHLGAYRLDVEAAQALSSLGFAEKDFTRPLSSFSGGWQMRAALARVLISRPDTLLLDEPSNYLDIPAVEWLCRFLSTFQGTLILISHDRFLLRKLTNVIVEINQGIATRYPGSYDFYCRERAQRAHALEAAKRNTDREKERLERLIDRFRSKSTKAAAAKSWQKKLDSIEDVELPDELNYKGVIRFPAPPDAGVEAVRMEQLSFGYDEKNLLFKDLDLTVNSGDKIGIIGYNGRGKTTLMKLMAGKLRPLSGRITPGHHAVIGYQAQEFSELLPDELSVYDAVREALPAGASTASLMNILGSFGFSGDDTEKRCGVLSGGERIRLQFARIFVNPPNFLLLDEPTTHLDLNARELLQQALCDFPGTVCIVSHDIEFVRNVATTILALEPDGIRKYYGNYDYYLEKSNSLIPAATQIRSDGAPLQDSAKLRRQERARARQAIQGDLKKAKIKVEKLEQLYNELSDRKTFLVAKLSGGGKVDFAALKKELAEVENSLAQCETDWEESAMELEALRLENDRIHSN